MASNTKEKLLPVYALIGTDKLKIQYVLGRLEKRLAEFGNIDFNKNVFDGKLASGAEIAQACLQMPFSSEKRYIVIKDADKLNKKDIEDLINYLEHPSDTSVVALVCSKLAKSTRLYKVCYNISATTIIDCAPPKKYQLADNVCSITREQGGSINNDAAHKLVEMVGDDTLKLKSEIQKLLTANGNTTININQVISQVKKSSDVKPWDFTNAFAQRDIKKCYKLFQEMPLGSEYQLLPQVCKMVKELICVKDLGENATQNSISQTLRCEPWKVKNHYMFAKNFTKDELIHIIIDALNCEIKCKSTSESALAFESFILKSLSN